jgi:serine/threonine-protein kinase
MAMPSLPVAPATRGETPTRDTVGVASLRRSTRIALHVRQSLIVLGLCATVVAAAFWMYHGVEQSLRSLREQGLPALLEAKTKSLEVFIAERGADAERLARDARATALTLDLARQSPEMPAGELCRGPEGSAWRERFAGILQDNEIVAVNAVDRSGRIIASTLPELCGLQAQPRTAAPSLAQVFRGRTQFIRPFAADTQLVAAQPFRDARPLAWVETPVRDAAGNVVAALGFASFVDRDFESILANARPGDTGETYAFDETGTLLSEVRDTRGLREAGLLPEGVDRTAFQLTLRDPGTELGAGEAPMGKPADWPLTTTVSRALAAGLAPVGAGPLRGVQLDPYRNYRGVEVIGAWRWLPDERIGVVAEMGLNEAYAPMRYVRHTLAGVLALLVITAGWAMWSTLTLARLARDPAYGRRIGAYRLERELAQGGTSTVHMARHALLKRPTAIKILKRHLASDEVAARFEREVRMVSELRHPNTIEIYDYGQTPDGLLYYAMEFVDGLTLEKLVAGMGALPLERMRHIILQTCAALAELHAKGMIHRDIKPDNVMVCERGGEFDFVKLLDFGIVKRVEVAPDADAKEARVLTRQFRLLGTPAYMAPERIGQPSGTDTRADIYGVGALIFFLVAGRAPFMGDDEAALLREVIATPAPRLSDLAPDTPVSLDDLVMRCLAKIPGERPGSVADIVTILGSLQLPPWTREDARRWWEAWRERGTGEA